MKISHSSSEEKKTKEELESLMNETKVIRSASIKYPAVGEKSSNRAEERETSQNYKEE